MARAERVDNHRMKRDTAAFHRDDPTTMTTTRAMSHRQLLGRAARLERELAEALALQPRPIALIDRLTAELAATQGEIAALRPIVDWHLKLNS
jgi:hypothetical protein